MSIDKRLNTTYKLGRALEHLKGDNIEKTLRHFKLHITFLKKYSFM